MAHRGGRRQSTGGGDRPRLLRARVAVLLTALVALLSFATGVVNIAATGFDLPGPLAGVVPQSIQQTAGFTGTMTGFLMLVGAYALRQGLRTGWYMTVVLLPVTAIQGVLQASQFSLPLVVLSLVSFPAVLANRRVFTRETQLTTGQLAALGALVGSLVYGTAGSWVLREEFPEGAITNPIDALWYAVVTASTVGYGDVTPTSPVGRLFGLSYLIVGTASFAIALGTLLGPAIEARFEKALGTMSDTDIDLLENHVIVVGFGDLTEPILEELGADSVDTVIVTRSTDRAVELRDRGFEVFTGDPSDEEPLRRVGIERARALVAATDDDAQDALAILTARELNPDIRIVAGATDRENTKKLRRAGADSVISPAVIGGHLLVRSALGDGEMEDLADRLLSEDDGGDPRE
ncbi:NAD-binding protein [Halomarina litorea]|uniref:NAD-binding protein n=1 Tax=Halomarina litorea TaxID=2961595 RepID=UPI0020C231E6|nr:NAD-binding protein [Halomarina sp. BCD28]